MSGYLQGKKKVTVNTLKKRKSEAKKLSMVTCYDASFAKLINKTDIDMVLVGDSLGNVMMGLEDTVSVKMQHMLHHTKCVSSSLEHPFLVADMPFMSYNISVEQAMKNAAILIQDGRANAVKVEGGVEICPQVKAMVDAGIPVVGHLGLTPQSINTMGGYKVQAREKEQREKLINDAKALEAAGCCAIVLEVVPKDLAKEVSGLINIPTIGIGAGADCDGQVLVMNDLLGFDDEFTPKFLKRYANLGEIITNALTEYDSDVKEKNFPSEEHTYS